MFPEDTAAVVAVVAICPDATAPEDILNQAIEPEEYVPELTEPEPK